jgi:hypothetical protein
MSDAMDMMRGPPLPRLLTLRMRVLKIWDLACFPGILVVLVAVVVFRELELLVLVALHQERLR